MIPARRFQFHRIAIRDGLDELAEGIGSIRTPVAELEADACIGDVNDLDLEWKPFSRPRVDQNHLTNLSLGDVVAPRDEYPSFAKARLELVSKFFPACVLTVDLHGVDLCLGFQSTLLNATLPSSQSQLRDGPSEQKSTDDVGQARDPAGKASLRHPPASTK